MNFVLVFGVSFIGLVLIALLIQLAMKAKSARMAKRIQKVGGSAPTSDQLLKREAQKLIVNATDTKLDSFFKSFGGNSSSLKTRLRRANVKMNTQEYLVMHLIIFLVVTAFAALFLALEIPHALGAGLVGMIVLPWLWLNRRIEQRVQSFNRTFPDALELMVRGLRTGLPITECIKAVARDIQDPVGPEFVRIRDDIRLGMSIPEACWKRADTLQTQEFNFFALALTIQLETGGNLAESLEKLAEILRKRQQIYRIISAKSSEARWTAKVLGALPFVMFGIIYITAPEYASKLVEDRRGQIMMAAGTAWIGVGILWMRSMIRFDF